MNRLAGLALVLVLAGCSSAPTPDIAVSGASASVEGLAGRWTGTYRLADGARRGVVSFDLAKGDATATGSVIMQPASQTTGDALAPRGDIAHPEGAGLAVRFVDVANGRVRGELDPYTDPDCACTVNTVFEGRQQGDRIEGTFTIRNPANGTTRKGDWSVSRRP
jgi:hypothetical protein